jgi:methylated-DNA-protein-cysteine methyltransferase related protein
LSNLNQELIDAVLVVVDTIPSGRVATYGQIARLIGRPKNARLVGKILSQSELYGGLHPCHRVVNAAGRLAPGSSKSKKKTR